MLATTRFSATLGVAAALMVACDGPPTLGSVPITSPGDRPASIAAEVGDRPASAILAPDALQGGGASGHASIHGTTVQNVRDETYSFTATSSGDLPGAKGEIEAHFLLFTGEEVTVHGSITCLAVVGNTAWVGGRVTRFSIDQVDQPAAVNRPMIIRAQDLGEGPGSDLASLIYFPPTDPNGDVTHCLTRPDFPTLRVSDGGNIQVTSR